MAQINGSLCLYGEAAAGTFRYSSSIGMILYMYGHTRPGVAFSVNFCY